MRAGATAALIAITLAGTACSAPPRWVAVAGQGGIVVYDAALLTADTLPVAMSDSVLTLRFAPDGSSVYLAVNGPEAAGLLAVRRATGEVVGAQQFPGRRVAAFWVSPDGRSVLAAVSSDSGGGVLLSLPPDLARTDSLASICDGPVRALAVFEPARRLFALCAGDRIADVDLALRTVVRTDAFGDAAGCGATDLGISANGTVLFALCPRDGRLLYLDRRTYAVLDSLRIGEGPVRMVQTPDRKHAVLPCPAGGEIVTARLRERRSIPLAVPFVPADVALTMNGRTAYAVGGAEGTLAALDLDRGVVVRSVPTLPGPQGVAVWPGPETPVMRWTR